MNKVLNRKEIGNQYLDTFSFSDIQEQLQQLQEQFNTKSFSKDFDRRLEALEKNVLTLKADESHKEVMQAIEATEGEIKVLREKYAEVVTEYKQATKHLQASIGKTSPQGNKDYQKFLSAENGMSDSAKQTRIHAAQHVETDLQQMKEEFPFLKKLINRTLN